MKLLSAAEKFKKIHGHFPQTDEEINLIKTNLSEEYRDRIRYMNYGSSNRGMICPHFHGQLSGHF